jgi:hypothetical protein
MMALLYYFKSFVQYSNHVKPKIAKGSFFFPKKFFFQLGGQVKEKLFLKFCREFGSKYSGATGQHK